MSTKYTSDVTFCLLLKFVLKSEGGYVNNPHDKGGPTNFGIAWNYNADYLKNNFDFKSADDMKQLTKEQASQCYFDKYWLASGSLGIQDIRLAYMHFDTAVNCGVGEAAKILSHIKDHHSPDAVLTYVSERLKYYASCHDQHTFLQGWVNRTANVLNTCVMLNEGLNALV